MIHAFRLLARLKFLRGTAFDLFGYAAERKAERRLSTLPGDDRAAHRNSERRTDSGSRQLSPASEMIRGYGHIKEQNIGKSLAEKARLEANLENNHFAVAAE